MLLLLFTIKFTFLLYSLAQQKFSLTLHVWLYLFILSPSKDKLSSYLSSMHSLFTLINRGRWLLFSSITSTRGDLFESMTFLSTSTAMFKNVTKVLLICTSSYISPSFDVDTNTRDSTTTNVQPRQSARYYFGIVPTFRYTVSVKN